MRAVVFDFDGVVLDTETTDYQSWRVLFDRHGIPLSLEEWVARIGTDAAGFNPAAELSAATGHPVAELRSARSGVRDEMVALLEPLPGVIEWIRDARRLEIRLAIASSSPLWWVEGHLTRIGLRDAFEALVTSEDVARVKPDPALYQLALRRLDVSRDEAFAVEDSPHGVSAAHAAGLACLAVPGPMTAAESFHLASLRIGSLAERSLEAVIEGFVLARP